MAEDFEINEEQENFPAEENVTHEVHEVEQNDVVTEEQPPIEEEGPDAEEFVPEEEEEVLEGEDEGIEA